MNSTSRNHGQSSYLEELLPHARDALAWKQEETVFGSSPVVECCGLGDDDDLYPMLAWLQSSTSTTTQVPRFEFKDLEDIFGDFDMWAQGINQSFFEEDNVMVDAKPLIGVAGETATFDYGGESAEMVGRSCRRSSSEERFHNGRCIKSSGLQLDEIRKYFDVPITKAAKELNVGLTVLKKRCRELNIRRWPHRKIKSLKFLIQNAKELGLTSEVEILEEHKRLLYRVPELELTERTKKLRQACFKANYKKRRALAMAAAAQG